MSTTTLPLALKNKPFEKMDHNDILTILAFIMTEMVLTRDYISMRKLLNARSSRFPPGTFTLVNNFIHYLSDKRRGYLVDAGTLRTKSYKLGWRAASVRTYGDYKHFCMKVADVDCLPITEDWEPLYKAMKKVHGI